MYMDCLVSASHCPVLPDFYVSETKKHECTAQHFTYAWYWDPAVASGSLSLPEDASVPQRAPVSYAALGKTRTELL